MTFLQNSYTCLFFVFTVHNLNLSLERDDEKDVLMCLVDNSEHKHEIHACWIDLEAQTWMMGRFPKAFFQHFGGLLASERMLCGLSAVLRGCPPTTVTAAAPPPVTWVGTEKGTEAPSLPKRHPCRRCVSVPLPVSRPFTPQDGVLVPTLVPVTPRSPRRGSVRILVSTFPRSPCCGPLSRP